jgi:hypothetical protein
MTDPMPKYRCHKEVWAVKILPRRSNRDTQGSENE